MLVHVVLFRPKADLTGPDRESLVAAIERAHREIPNLHSFRVGERTLRRAAYASRMPDFPYVAIIEVANEAALQAYLAHPAHAELARLFWQTSDAALAYDFTLVSVSNLRRTIAGPASPHTCAD